MKRARVAASFGGATVAAIAVMLGSVPAAGAASYDTSTLAGKVASVMGTAGLQVRMSAFLQAEADDGLAPPAPADAPITPSNVLTSPLDGTSVQAPDVTVNGDTAAAPQNETAIAVDPNNSSRVVAAANDYVTRTWSCTVGPTPCSALGDGYSGTYYSNDGGQTWCCVATDPSHLGTLIPGVDHLAGGPYDAGGDPSLAFDSRGNIYYAGLGFNRTSNPNTVAVNRGTFDSGGALTWSQPTFINQTTSKSILNDKEWIGVDANPASPYRDRIYVSFTRYVFNASNGNYVQSPINLAYSSDGGRTFSTPQSITGNVLYDQGSRPIVGPDGTVYVFFEGNIRKATSSSTYVVKSTDGGATWSKPVAIAPLTDIIPIANTEFRVNSFPAAAVAPDGTLYAAWSGLMSDTGGLCPGETNDGCHSTALYSRSTDGGKTWSAPVPVLPGLDAATQTPVGYPVTQPDGSTLDAPSSPRRVDTLWPGIAISPSGRVYMSAYAADVVSPWQTCDEPATPTAVGRIDCLQLGPYVDNARLDYAVTDLSTGTSQIVSTHPINTQYGFGGAFFGDYTDLAVGADNVFHAFWTDSNNVQTVTWFYGYEFTPTPIHQQDVVTASGSF
jgi:hypothetical protein